MMTSNLLQAVILVSEKAANIARAIRQEEHLLSLLVREKKDDEKNTRFLHDFKTLADVLVQEVVKHDLGKEFPNLIGHIYGEESNEFSCLDGEVLCLTIGNSENDTSSQLVRILGDARAAKTLAQLVHSTPYVNMDVPECEVSTEELGFWIDPIDSTAEYIAGGAVESSVPSIYSSGLPCVTVLIGAFHRPTGRPVMGVANQPFTRMEGERWIGNICWGVCHENSPLCSLPKLTTKDKKVVVLSSSESSEVKSKLISGGFTLIEAAGAGYKLLCVVMHLASAYVLSKSSTFYWDTCGLQAVLEASGGGVVNYNSALNGEISSLTYTGGKGTEECCNNGGFIAYNNDEIMKEIIKLIQ